MTGELWSYVYTVGAAQGVLLALALWQRPGHRASYRLLAGWIALLSVHLSVLALFLQSADPAPAVLLRAYGVTHFLPFLYAPLFYVYVHVLTRRAGEGGRRVWLHGLPFLFALLLHADFLTLSTSALDDMFARGMRPPSIPAWRFLGLDLLVLACGLGYLSGAARLVLRYRERLEQERADADAQGLHWLSVMATWQGVIWGVALFQSLVRLPGVNGWLIYGTVSAWIWALGYLSLNRPEPVAVTLEVAQTDAAEQPDEQTRYAQVLARVDRLMADEQLYRQPALGIGELAKRCGYPEYLVSQAINRARSANFYEFVNRWRVQAVQEAIAASPSGATLLDMAYDAGFTSKSTFNQAFKRYVGMTPSAYRKSLPAAPHTRPG